MDYFLMNKITFKILIKYHPEFINKILESINIKIKEFHLFELDTNSNNIDILLISSNTIINFQFNKYEKSLKRNKIYIESINKILYDYKIIQININLFKTNQNYKKNKVKIINLYKNENKYIKFITTKNYYYFKTKDKYILEVQNFLNLLNKKKLIKLIEEENIYKEYLDNLIQD